MSVLLDVVSESFHVSLFELDCDCEEELEGSGGRDWLSKTTAFQFFLNFFFFGKLYFCFGATPMVKIILKNKISKITI